jgi:Notch-like protein
MTPLMVAAVKGGGLDTGEEEEEDSTAAVIADLVAQGAELNATMDKTGETSLHLAARYARADAAKRLLDAGAEANSQDNTGRTPLHAAVAADAMGVFQVYHFSYFIYFRSFNLIDIFRPKKFVIISDIIEE